MITLLIAAAAGLTVPNTIQYIQCVEQREPLAACRPYRQGLIDGAVSQLRANANDHRADGDIAGADALDETADGLERQRDQ